jgi:hypothetical protein
VGSSGLKWRGMWLGLRHSSGVVHNAGLVRVNCHVEAFKMRHSRRIVEWLSMAQSHRTKRDRRMLGASLARRSLKRRGIQLAQEMPGVFKLRKQVRREDSDDRSCPLPLPFVHRSCRIAALRLGWLDSELDVNNKTPLLRSTVLPKTHTVSSLRTHNLTGSYYQADIMPDGNARKDRFSGMSKIVSAQTADDGLCSRPFSLFSLTNEHGQHPMDAGHMPSALCRLSGIIKPQ